MKTFNQFLNEAETLEEKNKPTQPEKWARAKAAAKSKFAVYPSAYANAWASKKYKSMGGGWRSTSEEVELEEMDKSQKSQERHGDYPLGVKNKDANMVKPIASKKVKQDTLKLLNKAFNKEEVEFYEQYNAEELFDILEEVVDGIAEESNIDSDILWENL